MSGTSQTHKNMINMNKKTRYLNKQDFFIGTGVTIHIKYKHEIHRNMKMSKPPPS